MVELNLNYDELVEMPLEDAKKIVKEFYNESFLEDAGKEINGINYGVKVLEEWEWIGDWLNDEYERYQEKTDIGVLCEFDYMYENVIKMFDIAITSTIIRKIPCFVEDGIEHENLRVNKIIKKVIPQQIISERTVVTLAEKN